MNNMKHIRKHMYLKSGVRTRWLISRFLHSIPVPEMLKLKKSRSHFLSLRITQLITYHTKCRESKPSSTSEFKFLLKRKKNSVILLDMTQRSCLYGFPPPPQKKYIKCYKKRDLKKGNSSLSKGGGF